MKDRAIDYLQLSLLCQLLMYHNGPAAVVWFIGAALSLFTSFVLLYLEWKND